MNVSYSVTQKLFNLLWNLLRKMTGNPEKHGLSFIPIFPQDHASETGDEQLVGIKLESIKLSACLSVSRLGIMYKLLKEFQ